MVRFKSLPSAVLFVQIALFVLKILSFLKESFKVSDMSVQGRHKLMNIKKAGGRFNGIK